MLNQLTYNAFHILYCSPFLFSQEHYKDLKDKPFFPKLIDYITSGPVVCMVYIFSYELDIFFATPHFHQCRAHSYNLVLSCKAWEGDGVVASARKLIGATNPLQAEPGTIRGDLAVQTGRLAATLFHVYIL
jgi:nucleoside-diphosphate kinase